MSECAIEERSARGYCPGEEGHQDEVDFAEEWTATTTEIPPELPFTGFDPAVGLVGSFCLILGVVSVKLSN